MLELIFNCFPYLNLKYGCLENNCTNKNLQTKSTVFIWEFYFLVGKNLFLIQKNGEVFSDLSENRGDVKASSHLFKPHFTLQFFTDFLCLVTRLFLSF